MRKMNLWIILILMVFCHLAYATPVPFSLRNKVTLPIPSSLVERKPIENGNDLVTSLMNFTERLTQLQRRIKYRESQIAEEIEDVRSEGTRTFVDGMSADQITESLGGETEGNVLVLNFNHVSQQVNTNHLEIVSLHSRYLVRLFLTGVNPQVFPESFFFRFEGLIDLGVGDSAWGDDRIIQMLADLPQSLRFIDLTHTGMGNRGVTALASAIRTRRAFELVNVSENRLSAESMQTLETAAAERGDHFEVIFSNESNENSSESSNEEFMGD
jgi:hypothetical protein